MLFLRTVVHEKKPNTKYHTYYIFLFPRSYANPEAITYVTYYLALDSDLSWAETAHGKTLNTELRRLSMNTDFSQLNTEH